jgi:hypothetical protein
MYGTYTGNVIESHPEARGQYIQINAGLESYVFDIKPKFQINPYLGTGAGFITESTYSGQDANIESQNSSSLLAYTDLGIRIGGPVIIISKSCLIGLLIGDIYTIPFYSKNQVVSNQIIEFLKPRNYFYVGFTFAVDL